MTRVSDIQPPVSPLLPSYDLGVVPYLSAQELQIRLRRAVMQGDSPGALILLEHPQVVTVGAHAPMTDLLYPHRAADQRVEVVRSERGGRTTIHAPGQLVAYPVLRIPRRDLRGYVHDLEEVLIHFLSDFGLHAHRLPGKPGLFIDEKKIASLGLRCEQGVTSHGSSLNVDVDLSLFDLITSCGEPGLRQTSVVRESGRPLSVKEAKTRYMAAFSEVLGIPLAPLRTSTCEEMLAALALC